MNITFIRHGTTKGNLEKRYIGITDEPLCLIGREDIKQNIKSNRYPHTDIVVASPMVRCIETAKLIYKKQELYICNKMSECNFGNFENKNYLELSENKDYQKWIDSNGTLAFPEGESIEEFKDRCIQGFQTYIQEFNGLDIVFVIHGGTIMAILEKFAFPRKDYYDWRIANGSGYTGKWYKNELINLSKII